VAFSERRVQVDEIMEKIYANQSACHMKKNNFKRALECAEKVTAVFAP
jgi:hypothetical protein